MKDSNIMLEPKPINDVAKFHHLFNLPVLDNPAIPSKERCALRVSLLSEELDELKEAIEDNDLVEIADALADLQYVLSGAILEFGLGRKFKEIFEEVQRSNMSKACKTIDEAKETQEYYLREKNTRSYIKEQDGEFLVYREGDQKVLKSVNYSPADLPSILKK